MDFHHSLSAFVKTDQNCAAFLSQPAVVPFTVG